jgi:hypothetical protein
MISPKAPPQFRGASNFFAISGDAGSGHPEKDTSQDNQQVGFGDNRAR